jgi:methionyl-tRNA formyltransferase
VQDKLKIGYFADGPWSHTAFDLLIEDFSLDIQFIVPRIDTKDMALRNLAKKHKIDYLCPVRINSLEFLDLAKAYQCDLFVSMSFDQIFRRPLFDMPKFKTINCHAGKLPFYRGRNVLNWALINDEKEFGITVHYIDDGIDTGDIILQRCFDISDNDNYNSILNLAFEECAKILYDSIKLIQNNETKPIRQSTIHPIGFYCGRRNVGDEIINWNQSSRDIFNFIRALCSPGPKATTSIDGSNVMINKANLLAGAPNYKNTPGQILAKSNDGFLVKTLDSFIEILEIESEQVLKVGDRLGT